MYIKSLRAIFSAVRSLCERPRALLLMVAAYIGLLVAVYLFISTREATISQLILTLVAVIAAPALFFVLQAVSVSYAGGREIGGLIRTVAVDCLKLIIVSLPVVALTVACVYGLNKVQSYVTFATALRYLLIGVIAPLLAIQLWVVTTSGRLRPFVKSLRRVLSQTFAPQSMFVYACGFLIFAVAPNFLLQKTIPVQRPWLELSVLVVRLTASAVLILFGWVTTVGALSILSTPGERPTCSD